MLDIAALALVATALLAYVNHRFFGLPTSIGVMAGALALSLALIGLDLLGVAHGLLLYERALLRSLDFSTVLMQGMLSLLLFAGALCMSRCLFASSPSSQQRTARLHVRIIGREDQAGKQQYRATARLS
jgi:hypothetical protein